MTSSEWANWVIAIFTIVLAIATIVYAVITAKMLSSSNKNHELLERQITESQKQVEALNELSKSIREVGPSFLSLLMKNGR